ncbi:MAG: hypothetical protein WDW38_004828 [Sanguina aurantia]
MWAVIGNSLVSKLSGLMGGPKEPPKVVLVPPMFERDLRSKARFAQSAYEHLFAKKAVHRLLHDYLQPEIMGQLMLSPKADPRVSVATRVGTKGGSMTLRWQPLGAAAPHTFVDIRANPQQPGNVGVRGSVFDPHTGLGLFMSLPLASKLSNQVDKVGIRYSSPTVTAGAVCSPGRGTLQELWLVGQVSGWTAGFQLQPRTPFTPSMLDSLSSTSRFPHPSSANPPPRTNTPSASTIQAAAATSLPSDSELRQMNANSSSGSGCGSGCGSGSGSGTSYGGGSSSSGSVPPPPPPPPAAAAAATGGGSRVVPGQGSAGPHSAAQDVGSWLAENGNCAVSYSPPAFSGPSGGGEFTAVIEVQRASTLLFSFFQHLALSRKVLNPFERDDVVAITSYVDIGMQLATPIGGGAAAAAAAESGGRGGKTAKEVEGVSIGAAWQVNKNWLVKGAVGSRDAAVAVGLRGWFQPSFAVTASANYNYATQAVRYGATVSIENHGALRYQRGLAEPSGRAVLQRHVASDADLANALGEGPLVQRSDSQQNYNIPLSSTYNCL